MKTATSISGGMTSAYLSANYPTDYMVFSLIRTSDTNCKFKDRGIAKIVEDRINKPFIGTLEDDIIIRTVLDLEQFLGRKITWVSGITYDELNKEKYGGYLPSVLRRYCTTELKLRPIFNWWYKNIQEPIEMNIGFRANEKARADKMLSKTNEQGLSVFKSTFEKGRTGRNKWVTKAWQKPNFPLITDFIYKEDIIKFWKGKNVKFAKLNNCIGCFHRTSALLKEMSNLHPEKFDWFVSQEKLGKGTWKETVSYQKIKDLNFTQKLNFEYDSEGCSSGYCGF